MTTLKSIILGTVVIANVASFAKFPAESTALIMYVPANNGSEALVDVPANACPNAEPPAHTAPVTNGVCRILKNPP